MSKKDQSQLPLDLPVPPARHGKVAENISTVEKTKQASVYSFVDRKVEKDKSELAAHFSAIVRLVRHF